MLVFLCWSCWMHSNFFTEYYTLYVNDCMKICKKKCRSSGWCYYLLPERIYFFSNKQSRVRDYLSPIRNTAGLRLSFRYYKVWPTSVCSHSYGVAFQKIQTANLGLKQQQKLLKAPLNSLSCFLLTSHTLLNFYPLIQKSLRVRKHL